MKRQILLFFLLAVFAATARGQTEEYTINLQSGGKEIAVIELINEGDIAITKVADVTERFDLKSQQWLDDDSQQWVTLPQCESWAKQSKEKSTSSAAAAPENSRPFVRWSFDPQFEISFTKNMLTLNSGQVDYDIEVEKSGRDLKNYYRYARLNAYKKAMLERQLPPFAELLVLKELESRKRMPKAVEIQIPGIAGAPSFKMLISAKVER